ncbi:VWA domain-containing protein [Cellulomonas sp. zg-ZUI222]|uniref:vWA domain-containing protein n=1 Tax=Cellulomonas TaxID=1707 RepID=UPI001A947351|nr:MULTISPECIES: VWA domain-containing protein [Cellulomonas]MBO0899162.1 VWA domain-containing protein [Cellulomonas sp. zg-ZUI22]MBO0920012.1 VWA domain-containing protein [Cellulomonas wangleii]
MSARAVVPVVVVLLTALPVLALCVGQALRASGRRGAPGAPGAPAGTWWRRTALVVVLAVVALTPTVAATQSGGARVGVQVWFVVDRTGSMAAEDWGPGDPVVRGPGLPAVPAVQRLDGVRHDVVQLTRDVPGAFYSVVAFADEAGTQLPLTDDATAVRSWAQTVTQEVTAGSAGTRRDRALEVLQRSLQDAQDRDPGMVRLVFYLSDGEQTADEEPGSFTAIAPLVDGGAVLGYGTAAGAPMRQHDGSLDPDAPYIPDPQDPSRPALSHADEAALREVAAELGVPYVHRDGPTPTADLVADVDVAAIAADGRADLSTHRDLVWPFALVAGVLLAAEAWAWARSSSRLRGRR